MVVVWGIHLVYRLDSRNLKFLPLLGSKFLDKRGLLRPLLRLLHSEKLLLVLLLLWRLGYHSGLTCRRQNSPSWIQIRHIEASIEWLVFADYTYSLY